MLTQDTYKQFFESRDFQKKWKAYKAAFGKDLDGLFGDNYNAKVRLAEGLQLLLDGKLHDAYHGHLRHFADLCETRLDRAVFDRLVALCFNESEMSAVREGDWVKRSLGDDFLYARVEKRLLLLLVASFTFHLYPFLHLIIFLFSSQLYLLEFGAKRLSLICVGNAL